MGQILQRRSPADADDVAALNDVVDVSGAALSDVFLYFLFIFNGRVGDADVAQSVGGSYFLGQLALVSMGSKISMRTKPLSLACCKSRETEGRDNFISLAISAWLKLD